ncbi:hypothetical protein AOQ84DRAFT_370879 [Glonium stellatum]|uniref:DNA polymerase n=1 Tax=Glonium stellatum TaxID=574774 RepID=A0A8E2FD89_9PEZI|nr:hypothetical protein AOQ84DRAFT_370879 [Glonium stellatum]
MDIFRFRLNCIDHYQATPTELDPRLRHSCLESRVAAAVHPSEVAPLGAESEFLEWHNAPHVPVIRAFGATETGQKVCAHIHGALPYLFLEYEGTLDKKTVDAYIYQLRASIDNALAVSYRRNPGDDNALFVGHISLVKGVPFYGYHVGYKLYLKVYMLNPSHMTRLADLLHQGAIMNKPLQPHESHLQYLLQWMCDFNIYGCAYVNCSRVRFRSPVPSYPGMSCMAHKWHDKSIPENFVSDSDQFPRQSHCSIEVDVCVQDILNREEISARPLHLDFVERIAHLGPDYKFVHSMAGLWRDETRRRKERMGLTDPSSSPFSREALVSMSADARNTGKGGWIHEDEHRSLVKELIQEETNTAVDFKASFANSKKSAGMENYVKTALESVEDLFPRNLEISRSFEKRTENNTGPPTDDLVSPKLDTGSQQVEQNTAEVIVSDIQNPSHLYAQEMPQDIDQIRVDSKEGPQVASAVHNQVSNELMGAARSHDLNPEVETGDNSAVYKVQRDSVARLNHSGVTETKRAFSPGQIQPTKRLKLSPMKEYHSEILQDSSSGLKKYSSIKRVSFQNPRGQNEDYVELEPTTQKDLEGNPPQTSTSSQGSIKAHSANAVTTLSFPVVKNPNNPETIIRVSQTGYSNTQNSPIAPTPKASSSGFSTDPQRAPWNDQKGLSPGLSNSSQGVSPESPLLATQLGTIPTFATLYKVLYYGHVPPSSEMIESTMVERGLPPVIYQDAYYSNEKDVPERPREYAGREFKLGSTNLPYLPSFDPCGTLSASFGEKLTVVPDKAKEALAHHRRKKACGLLNWEIASSPPSITEVERWLVLDRQQKSGDPSAAKAGAKVEKRSQPRDLSQVDGPTQKNTQGFKYSQMQKSINVKYETQYMSIMSLEIHVNTRGSFVPDPIEDEIACVFWCIQSDDEVISGASHLGTVALSNEDGIARKIAKQVAVKVEYEEDELDLINRVVSIVRQFDPDILTGYEVHNSSWGYIIERARLKYEYNLCDEFSRVKSQSHGRFGKDTDRWGFTHTSTIRITGRHMINIWRAMRGELNLLQYTMENVVFHLLHKRIPHYHFQDLTSWYTSLRPRDLAKVLDYFLSRVQLNLEILEANELISRTSEQARLLGVDFFSVFSRGSQFKVESLMFRIAKPENFILVSPSRKQVGQQNALECLPLVMEPQSAFYSSPLLVLDFQSLYPSIMIAYNYCYSTCLGRIVSWRGRQNKLGFTDFQREPQLLELVKEHINIAPNGIMYVKSEMRKSLLAKMLAEILETRVMVKSGMKEDKDDKALQQLLNNRQLALKLIANVTYGYTSASFSGRMPCSEIADSIVQTGRETLEKAIALIHSREQWGAEVVYGDTDSLFIHLKGRTRDQAFAIGKEIAEAVTNANPRPIKLKFEKVYHPCVLLAKKRYVGFKYESPSQTVPEFDAKGTETVRRDGTPAEQKIEEKALKILFRTSDLSEVKRYFQNQCTKIMTGRISIQDFLFAKEVKLGNYSDKGPPPPGALVATKRMLVDPRTEPQYGERVPYVVVTGAPGARLIDRCVSPETLLLDDHLELDADYYIFKNLIPPLERIFNLVGANIKNWYDEMPKVQRIRNVPAATMKPAQQRVGPGSSLILRGQAGLRKTLESYMKSSSCLVCREKLLSPPSNIADIEQSIPVPLCLACTSQPSHTLFTLRMRIQKSEARTQRVDTVCRSCSNLAFSEEVRCDSRDCPVFYTRLRERATLAGLRDGVANAIEVLEDEKFSRGGMDMDW